MKRYELVVVTTVSDKNLLANLKAELKKWKVKVGETKSLGVKQLAYPIKKQQKGNYTYFELETEENLNLGANLNRFFYLNNKGYLRHLLVIKEE